jgi:predicted AAA+ superfamily ATPase
MNHLIRNSVKDLMKSFCMYLLIKAKYFSVDGARGSGKTFLYKALLARVWSEGLIVIAIATSGLAA